MLPVSASTSTSASISTSWLQINPKWLSLILLVVQSTVLVLAISFSRLRPGERALSSGIIVCAEALKVIASAILLAGENGVRGAASVLVNELTNVDTLKLAVPGILYLIQNNLLFIALSNLDAAVYQVTYQLKILTTAMFSVSMLGSSLSRLQIFSLILLTGGVSLVQLSKMEKESMPKVAVIGHEKNHALGLVCVLLACVSSGFAGVYLEKVMKKGRSVSIWVRNVQLGIFGAVFGFGGVFMSDFEFVNKHGFFHGYDALVWFVVFNQALGGLMIAMVIKYADNILKGFATSISIILSSLLSMWLFDFEVSILFGVGTLLVVVAVFLYGFATATFHNSRRL